MTLLFGSTIEQAVQHIVAKAWSKRTPEAMREASQKLHGIATFLIFQGDNVKPFSAALVRLGNERHRCEMAADALTRGHHA